MQDIKVTSKVGGLYDLVLSGVFYKDLTRKQVDDMVLGGKNVVVPAKPTNTGIMGGIDTSVNPFPTKPGPATLPPGPDIGSPTKGTTSMDLGNLLGDVIKGVTEYQIAKAQQPSAVQPVGYAPADNPFIPNAVEQFFVEPGTLPGYGHACKRRRRRRPIATDSEIAQVTALKATLSPQEMKVWLAKRLRN